MLCWCKTGHFTIPKTGTALHMTCNLQGQACTEAAGLHVHETVPVVILIAAIIIIAAILPIPGPIPVATRVVVHSTIAAAIALASPIPVARGAAQIADAAIATALAICSIAARCPDCAHLQRIFCA